MHDHHHGHRHGGHHHHHHRHEVERHAPDALQGHGERIVRLSPSLMRFGLMTRIALAGLFIAAIWLSTFAVIA